MYFEKALIPDEQLAQVCSSASYLLVCLSGCTLRCPWRQNYPPPYPPSPLLTPGLGMLVTQDQYSPPIREISTDLFGPRWFYVALMVQLQIEEIGPHNMLRY